MKTHTIIYILEKQHLFSFKIRFSVINENFKLKKIEK